MKETAADDREANSKNKPAIHKLKMSKLVFSQLVKKDLQDMFLDGGILSGECVFDQCKQHIRIINARLNPAITDVKRPRNLI